MTITELTELAQVRALVATGAARSIRLSANLSLAEVSETLGVSPATVLRWETGQRSPHGEAAIAYGRLLAQLVDQQRPRRPTRDAPLAVPATAA